MKAQKIINNVRRCLRDSLASPLISDAQRLATLTSYDNLTSENMDGDSSPSPVRLRCARELAQIACIENDLPYTLVK